MSQERVHTLSTPQEIPKGSRFEIDADAPVLTKEETTHAMSDLNVNNFTVKYSKVERSYADPPIDLQRIGLISFVPAKGARPNEQGIFGFAKLRGNFQTEVEADQQARKIIKNTDSYHKIFHAYVGRPFPLTTESNFSKLVDEVDIQKSVTDSFSADVKEKREKEKREMEEIKEREKRLLDDSKKPEVPIDDQYTTLNVKKAQLSWTYAETLRKMETMKASILKARKEIADLDEKDPTLKTVYMKKYMDARAEAGLDMNNADQSFIKYMVEDIDLGF